MTSYTSLVVAYIFGGITLIPIVLFILYIVSPYSNKQNLHDKSQDRKDESIYRDGWLHVTQDTNQTPNDSTFFRGILKPRQQYKYALLKFGTLLLYDSDIKLQCQQAVHLDQYSVEIYPTGIKENEFFSKRTWIHLKPKNRTLPDYYLKCSRCIDKEDWYMSLVRSSHPERFEPTATQTLPKETNEQWLNALLGRLFLGVYKTERAQDFFYQKMVNKVNQWNAHRPPFLDKIKVRSVDSGHEAPTLSQPRLIHLSPQGEYTCEMHVRYEGCFRAELETVLTWTYSDRLPPIRINLVLAITLKSLEGKMMVKIKEPPSHRAWYGFYQCPKMDWAIEPVVWEKRIGYSVISKMIQARIEEMVKDTWVLPNMDDLVFFNSDLFDRHDAPLSPTPTLLGEPISDWSHQAKDADLPDFIPKPLSFYSLMASRGDEKIAGNPIQLKSLPIIGLTEVNIVHDTDK